MYDLVILSLRCDLRSPVVIDTYRISVEVQSYRQSMHGIIVL